MNDCKFIGYVAQQPELKTTQSGIAVCEFDLGIPRRKKSGDQATTIWDYVTIVAWRELAQTCSRLFVKGTKLAVSTSLQTSTYEKDGVKRKKTTFVLNDFDFCEKKATGASAPTASPANTPPSAQPSYQPQTYQPQSESGAQDYTPQFETIEDEEELPF